MTSEHELFDAYDKRFLKALETMPLRRPWEQSEREEILDVLKRCLNIRPEWIPEIHILNQTKSVAQGDITVKHLQAKSWAQCYTAADLYLPKEVSNQRIPIVLLACGHGAGGKRALGYRLMAEHLARHGFGVLVHDNIGQGEREWMGHKTTTGVFECGLTLQGLIVLETMGWLRWIQSQSEFDLQKISMIGNSGGGLLGMLLGTLCRDDFAAISSSGYPSTFEFIARKEKNHCHCNILPHMVGELEMWQLYGSMAPKPLLIFQGLEDHLFPADIFYHVARKVAHAYHQQNAATQFQAQVMPGKHSWDAERRQLVTEFLCKTFSLPFHTEALIEHTGTPEFSPCFPHWPADAKSIESIAQDLTGKSISGTPLWEIIPIPAFSSHPPLPLPLGDVRNIFAQFELFLKPDA